MMNIGAAGAVVGLGIGSMDGSSGVERTVALGTLVSTPSSAVNISSAAQSKVASDGMQGASMSELTQTLIVALLLQLLQGSQVNP